MKTIGSQPDHPTVRFTRVLLDGDLAARLPLLVFDGMRPVHLRVRCSPKC